jgi:hypothetical protein
MIIVTFNILVRVFPPEVPEIRKENKIIITNENQTGKVTTLAIGIAEIQTRERLVKPCLYNK